MKRGPYKGSFLWNLKQISIEKISLKVKESRSIRELCQRLELDLPGKGYKAWHSLFKENEIDTSHFTGKAWNGGKKYFFPGTNPEKILILREKKASTGGVRNALLKIGRCYICELCGIGPEWNGKKLVLQIDHRDGNRLDDRKENVRFLCPNCHSQTDTFTSKNSKKFKSKMPV